MLIAGPARRRFIHNPNLRSVRVHYEAIPKDHPTLPAAEHALEKIVHVLVQLNGCRASIVPCLHRAERGLQDLPVVLHATLLDVEVLEMLHLMNSAIPVHLYIGDPLTTGTPFDAYSPEKLVIPSELRPGDPIFCASTERVTVFTAYLHLPRTGTASRFLPVKDNDELALRGPEITAVAKARGIV